MADHTSPLSVAQRLQHWSQVARQVIDIRLALVIGLLAFMVAVSVDSAGNAAAAADLPSSARPAVVVTLIPETAAELPDGVVSAATARRLHHGTMTSALTTSNRLTEAHLFTDLPDGE